MSNVPLSGELLRFGFRSESGVFAVAYFRDESDQEFIAVGALGHVTEGQHLSMTGWWMAHPRFGRQFKVKTVLIADPRTVRGLELYLSSGAVEGMGPTIAKRVVAHFGMETLQVLCDAPQRLLEVHGVGKKRLAQITAHWKKESISREVEITLRGHGVGAALSRKIVETYGDEALAMLTAQPFRLATEIHGVGFRTADALATANGLDPNAPQRAAAAIIHSLREAGGEGHCYLPGKVLLDRVEQLGVPRAVAAGELEQLATRGDLVFSPSADPDQEPVYLPGTWRSEQRVARRLHALIADPPRPLLLPILPIEAQLEMVLSAPQRAAIAQALASGVSVITGGPGTGKTTIVRVLLAAVESAGQRWKLAAPTGRAARRLAEATDSEATTLHRLLEFSGHSRRFAVDFTNPIDADGVLVDEASMIDLRLFDALLSAIPPHCRLVLVGDADQLPSVGAGAVLADIITSNAVPIARLTEVYRQAAHSGIVRSAHRINRGEVPTSGEHSGHDDFFCVWREDPADARAALLDIVARRLPRRGFDPLRDVQVLTPMHGGPLGTTALNRALQELLNPDGAAYRRGDRELRVRDRVIQVRNDYEHEVFNGDIGTVTAVSEAGVTVDFDGQIVLVRGERLSELQLAYAISVHKSQGSEYGAVVVVTHRAHWIMLRRNLLYTAITRAKRFCCVLGTEGAVQRAVSQQSGTARWTGLAARL